MSVSVLGPCLCQAGPAVPPRWPSLCLLQLCEKEEEEELTERSEQDSGINEEPLLTAEQVPRPPRAPECLRVPQKPSCSPLAWSQPASAPWPCAESTKKGQIPSSWDVGCRFGCRWRCELWVLMWDLGADRNVGSRCWMQMGVMG